MHEEDSKKPSYTLEELGASILAGDPDPEGTKEFWNKIAKQQKQAFVFMVVAGIIVASLGIVAAYFLITWIWGITNYLWVGAIQFLTGFPGVVVGVLIIIGVAFGLFELRKRQRLYYGILEISFALCTSGKAVYDLLTESNDTKHWIVVGAAVYLFVRGMDNISEMRRSRSLPTEQEREALQGLKKFVKLMKHFEEENKSGGSSPPG
jgi:hypothetical protein